jgi:hypothetical protein
MIFIDRLMRKRSLLFVLLVRVALDENGNVLFVSKDKKVYISLWRGFRYGEVVPKSYNLICGMKLAVISSAHE